ncbi:MAG: glycosyltransferase [Actinomycetota bacterium]|nr:glycosyltransferase [Actinomycetota bacterium]
MTRRLRVLTWHVHGSYLENLARAPHDFFLPLREGRPEGYGACLPGFDWGPNVREVPAEDVRRLALDVVVFQSRRNWEIDQYELLSPAQQRLPRIFLEHDPPREVPTDTRHVVDQSDVLLVHVTPFNDLMWDSGRTPTRVIDHGVAVPADVRWTGERDQGLAVVNCLERRGRRAGVDVFLRARGEVPLELVGMESERLGGRGEIPRTELAAFEARYRFFFNPIRYTSLGLAVLEAMAIGMPVVGLATTEMATAIESGVSGYVNTDLGRVVEAMRDLLKDWSIAAELGEGARRRVLERFHIDRFVRDWDAALRAVAA